MRLTLIDLMIPVVWFGFMLGAAPSFLPHYPLVFMLVMVAVVYIALTPLCLSKVRSPADASSSVRLLREVGRGVACALELAPHKVPMRWMRGRVCGLARWEGRQ